MSRFSRRAVAIVLAGASIVIVGLLFWPDMRTEPMRLGAPVPPSFAQNVSTGKSVAEQLSEAFESAAERVGPSVVPIYAEKTVERTDEMEMFRRFFGDQLPGDGEEGGQQMRSMGSGVIARADGYILTNNHVVAGAQRLRVVLEDGKQYDAKIVGTDPPTDLAVIRIDAKNLPVAQFGTSENLRVGQWVIAVGNPFQLLHSVTAGIVSARGRSSIGVAAYEDFIQTDASINPGNSGGALADLDGRVVGINTAIASMTGTNAGVGFAIPIDMAKLIMEELINEGGVTRGYLAVLPQDITEELARALDLPSREGALVGSVTPGGPGDKGGIERGDVIVEFNGKKVKNSSGLRSEVARADPDNTVNLTVIRDGKRKTLKVKLGERPSEVAQNDRERNQQPEGKLEEEFGLALQELTGESARQLGYENARGAVVAGVKAGSPASDAGLSRGDLIVEIDHKPVQSAGDAERVLSSVKSKDTVALVVRRGENTFYVPLTRGSGVSPSSQR